MKLSAWLDLPNPDGSRKRRDEFAARIDVTPQMISAYCSGDVWPGKDRQRLIFKETGGAVTPNDWADIEQAVQ
jgi:hypothetical protein